VSDELPSLPRRRYFAPKWILGAIAGLVIGLMWGVASGCLLFDGGIQKPEFLLYLAAILTSMTLTGLLVGALGRWPEFFGLFIGSWAATVFFLAFMSRYLRPPFGILMVAFMPPVGAFGGAITGLLPRLLIRFSSNK
jgi:hypothetical protein